MDLVDPTAYLTLLPDAMKKIENQFNKAAIIELYNTVDFIGISSYAALKGQFLLPDLEDAIMQFDVELRQFGPNLQEVRLQLPVCQLAHAMPCSEPFA
jgi:hypothetical protein